MKVLHYLIISTIVTGLLSTARADFEETQLPDLLSCSELIVIGEIAKVLEDSYELTISKQIHGSNIENTIIIQKFEDWTCATRWGAYAKGQKLLLCLNKGKDQYNRVTWKVLGSANEGEFPIYKSKIYIVHPVHSRKDYKIYNLDIKGIMFDLSDFIEAIQDARSLFKREKKEGETASKPIIWYKALKDETIIEASKQKSSAHQYILNRYSIFNSLNGVLPDPPPLPSNFRE